MLSSAWQVVSYIASLDFLTTGSFLSKYAYVSEIHSVLRSFNSKTFYWAVQTVTMTEIKEQKTPEIVWNRFHVSTLCGAKFRLHFEVGCRHGEVYWAW